MEGNSSDDRVLTWLAGSLQSIRALERVADRHAQGLDVLGLSVYGDSHRIGLHTEDQGRNVEVIRQAGVQTNYTILFIESVTIR